MAAYEEFVREQQAIDELLFKGYTIVGIQEDLDGANVKFVMAEPAKGTVNMQLLTADARKYVTTLLFSKKG